MKTLSYAPGATFVAPDARRHLPVARTAIDLDDSAGHRG